MKITTSQLRRIIAEEVKSSLNEATRTPDTLLQAVQSLPVGGKITNISGTIHGGVCSIFKVGKEGRGSGGSSPAYVVVYESGKALACYDGDEVAHILGRFSY